MDFWVQRAFGSRCFDVSDATHYVRLDDRRSRFGTESGGFDDATR